MATPDQSEGISPAPGKQLPALAAELDKIIDDAAFVAANQFLGSGLRFERNRRRRNAWEVLELDVRVERAKLSEPSARNIEMIITDLLTRRIAILDMDHQAIPAEALGRPGSGAPGW